MLSGVLGARSRVERGKNLKTCCLQGSSQRRALGLTRVGAARGVLLSEGWWPPACDPPPILSRGFLGEWRPAPLATVIPKGEALPGQSSQRKRIHSASKALRGEPTLAQASGNGDRAGSRGCTVGPG